MPVNDPLKEIQTRLEKYPDTTTILTDQSIVIEPANEEGFWVGFMVEENEYIVAFDGWHEHFEDVETALDCFAFGLSEKCRLKTTSRGRWAHKWTVQSWENGAWVDDSTTGLLFFAFWNKPKITFRQNCLVKSV